MVLIINVRFSRRVIAFTLKVSDRRIDGILLLLLTKAEHHGCFPQRANQRTGIRRSR